MGLRCARRYYSLFTLGMLVMFECTVVGQRLRNLRELRSLTVPKQALQARPQRIPETWRPLFKALTYRNNPQLKA